MAGLINRDYSPDIANIGNGIKSNRKTRGYIYIYIHISYYFHANETLIYPLPILCLLLLEFEIFYSKSEFLKITSITLGISSYL